MGSKKQYLVRVYEKQYQDLKDYCDDKFEIMAGVVSRLIRQFIERIKKKEHERIPFEIREELQKTLKGENSEQKIAKDIIQGRNTKED